jgi:Cys-rich protein (TIGR01571 family)
MLFSIFFCLILVELFGCFEDIPTLLVGWICPCYLFGQNAEQVDGSNKIGMCVGYACLSGCYLCCLLHKPRREKLRATYNLVEQPSDLLATCCFTVCANCQEAREMQMRGLFVDD